MKTIAIFKIKVHPIKKLEFIDIIRENIEKGNQIVQNGINAASINELVKDENLEKALSNSDLVNIDGMSVVWALRFLGYKVPERVACPDLADEILKLAEEKSYGVFLFGAREESVISCVRKITETYPKIRITGYRNGYYNEEEESLIVSMINSSNAEILFLGLPSPRKEFFAETNKHVLIPRYILGVGGYFDIFSGLTRRAPRWMQNIGMEWFYRFVQEPRRMYKRYLFGNLRFILLILNEKFCRGNSHDVKTYDLGLKDKVT
jgi:N-acetylglucosaminyldiphosphoundecaprenol N-acetyl-beta-D-mannosaminyltransferase